MLPLLPPAASAQLVALDALRSCVGWTLESAAEDPVAGELRLRLGSLFRLCLTLSRTGASGALQLLPEGEAPKPVPADRRALAAALAGCAAGPRTFELPGCVGGVRLGAAVQAVTARLARIAALLSELDGLRLALPPLADVACSEGSVRLLLLNLDAEVRFSVELRPSAAYPAGPLGCASRVWFDGEGQVSERRIAEAVASAPEGVPGRLRAAATALAALARSAVPRPALAADAAFHSSWQNPLFGGQQQQQQQQQQGEAAAVQQQLPALAAA